MLSLAFPLFSSSSSAKKARCRPPQPKYEPSTYIDCKIGGSPIFPSPLDLSSVGSLVVCPVCQQKMYCLLQTCTPFGTDESFDRLLYVCMCNSYSCMSSGSSSTRAFVLYVKRKPCGPNGRATAPPPTRLLASNPFLVRGDESISRLSLLLSEAKVSGKSSPGQLEEEDDPEELYESNVLQLQSRPFPAFPIEFEDVEEEHREKTAEHPLEEMVASSSESSFMENGLDLASEGYERVIPSQMDLIFYKFDKEISKDPWQVIRYEWDGEPLLAGPLGGSEKRSCPHCASPMVFELQLMPCILHLLQTEMFAPPSEAGRSPLSSSGMEWSTVLVYSCSQDCAYQKMALEKVVSVPSLCQTIVQQEQ